MIKFKSITWKNFLSTGNAATTIDLDRSKTTLIIGKNGHGKCLRGSTEVEVEAVDPETLAKLESFLSNQS